jgi:enoyl-[acyl-carrier-protein] reductase (NADH)
MARERASAATKPSSRYGCCKQVWRVENRFQNLSRAFRAVKVGNHGQVEKADLSGGVTGGVAYVQTPLRVLVWSV